MGDSDSSLSLTTLFCQEDEACFLNDYCNEDDNIALKTKDEEGDGSSCCFVLESEDFEYIEKLVQRETGCFGSAIWDCSSAKVSSWLKRARLDAIEWFLNARAMFGFQFQTAYLSVTYLDRFLLKRFIGDGKWWAIRLLSVACLSLAAKMEECRVPALSEFPAKDYCFENIVIQRMELLVLSTLDWKMGSITPFAYLHYFINRICGESGPKEVLSGAVESIMAIIKELDLLDHRPSTIAAAAVLSAVDCQLTRKELELKMNLLSLWSSQENEHLFSCYISMQEKKMAKFIKTPKLVLSPYAASTHSGSVDVVQNNSSFPSAAGAKRRLTFTDSDLNCSVKKIGRP